MIIRIADFDDLEYVLVILQTHNVRRHLTMILDTLVCHIFVFWQQSRVLAKELDPDSTLVSEVMTPSPESVEPEMSLLDALHLMHDQKYLHLPVVCEGATKGLVDAMDVMNATMGDGSGEGWRTFWEQTLEVDDDESDTASQRSARSGVDKPSKLPAKSAAA